VGGRLLAVAAVVVAALAVGLLLLARPHDSTTTSATAPTAPTARDDAAALAPARTPPRANDANAGDDRARTAARDEREAALDSVRASGDAHEEWAARGTTLLTSAGQHGAQVYGAGCFIAGCGATLSFASDADYRRGIDALVASDAYTAWTGGKKITAPERQPDGHVLVGVVLYRPD
jgi:hypothetical protein